MQLVLDNWQTLCRRDLHIPARQLPWIIFYDEDQAWHLKPNLHLLPSYKVSTTKLRFHERSFTLVKISNPAGQLWVPGRPLFKIDLEKPQVATMLYDKNRRPFFIVPLPGFYHRLGSADQAADLDELFLGLTAHELTHTLNLVYGWRQINLIRARNKLPESFDDNLVQQEFGTDPDYRKAYEEERALLTSAVMAPDLDECREKVGELLAFSMKRKERFFVGDKAGYSNVEDVFLALEGTGMWAQFKTARARAPQQEDWLTTLIRLSEKTDAWSQEEGLGLFLLMDRLVPNWQRRFLNGNLPSPFAVLREALDKESTGTAVDLFPGVSKAKPALELDNAFSVLKF
jgi:hypothetical protein